MSIRTSFSPAHRGDAARGPRRLIALVAALALLAGASTLSGVAFAFWTGDGSGSSSSSVGTLGAPTAVTGAQVAGTGTVNVSWSAPSGLAPDGYYVLRTPSSGPAVAACGTSASATVAATSCADGPVPVGTYTYLVVAVHQSWTATSAAGDPVPVEQTAQVITFTSAPVDPAFGGDYTVTATGGASGNPVVFSAATPAVCTVTTGGSVSFVHAGTCTINADQAGTTYYSAAVQAQQTFEVAKAPQAITLTSTPPAAAVVEGSGYQPTASSTGSANPVVFTIDATTAANCSINAGVVSYLKAGTCTINANKAGDADHLAAPQVQQSFAITPAAQAINVTSTIPADAKVNDTYTVSATGGNSGNAVIFSIDPGSAGVCHLSGSTVTFDAAGTCRVNANQAGNDDYLPAAQVQQVIVVTKRTQTIDFPQPASPADTGTSAVLSASASSGLGVTFSTSSAATICTVSGTTVAYVGAGTCVLRADQGGNVEYDAATQVQRSVTVVVPADTTAPAISGIEPGNESGGWNSIACSVAGQTGRICVSATDAVGVTSVEIKLTKANGRCWSGSGSTTFAVGNCSTLISLTQSGGIWISNLLVRQGGGGQPNFTDSSYTLEVTVKDAAGNTTTATRTFTVSGG